MAVPLSVGYRRRPRAFGGLAWVFERHPYVILLLDCEVRRESQTRKADVTHVQACAANVCHKADTDI